MSGGCEITCVVRWRSRRCSPLWARGVVATVKSATALAWRASNASLVSSAFMSRFGTYAMSSLPKYVFNCR